MLILLWLVGLDLKIRRARVSLGWLLSVRPWPLSARKRSGASSHSYPHSVAVRLCSFACAPPLEAVATRPLCHRSGWLAGRLISAASGSALHQSALVARPPMSSVQMMPPAAAVATDGAAAYDANAAGTATAAAAAPPRSLSPSPSRRPLLPHQQVTSSPAQPQTENAQTDAAQSATATVAAAADSAAAAATIPSALDEAAAASAASAPPTARSLRPMSAQASRRSSTTRHPSEVRIHQRTVAEKPKQRPSADKTNTAGRSGLVRDG